MTPELRGLTPSNKWTFVLLFVGMLMVVSPVQAQEHAVDTSTHLLLHCNNSMTGASGEVPSVATGIIYGAGILSQGCNIEAGSQLSYPAAGNIGSAEGCIEFWFRPAWNGSDNISHSFIEWGSTGGILIAKDAANNLRIIVNRFSANGNPEPDAAINVGAEWIAGEWHHCAFNWNGQVVEVFVDGRKRNSEAVGFSLPAISQTQFQVGGQGGFGTAEGMMDELRISNRPRTSQEIIDSFMRGLSVSSITVTPDPMQLLETWTRRITVTGQTSLGTRVLPAAAFSWSSGNPLIASIDSEGILTAIAAGSTTGTATRNAVNDSFAIQVTAPVLPPHVDVIEDGLDEPMPGAIYPMPVVVLRYLPTLNGSTVDVDETGWSGSLSDLRQQIDTFNRRVKFMLEEGSRFRGYSNPAARPSLGYRVVYMVTVYEPLPRGKDAGGGAFFPDYAQIMNRWNLEHFVEDLGVKEVWLWGYHHGEIVPAESNMSSPTTGDISNSYRFQDDLPVFDRTYVVYNYNFDRTQAEAVHNHGHQLEAILSHACQLQDGDTDLFWKQFVGQNPSGQFITGRCGWTHMPPNTTSDYDYVNPAFVMSDIRDWRPTGGGQSTNVNSSDWANVSYDWGEPPEGVPQRVESQWYIYWMQSMPGFANGISHPSGVMSNWWAFTGEWDQSITTNLGLHLSATGVPAESPPVPPELGVWPNPGSGGASFTIGPVSVGAEILVFDAQGRLRKRLGPVEPSGEVLWDGRDMQGQSVEAGIYFVRALPSRLAPIRNAKLVVR